MSHSNCDHDHSHHGHHHHTHSNLKLAFWLNLFFAIFEFVGGIYTNSMSILSDSLHDFGDAFTIGLSVYFEKISKKKRDSHFSYGYKRFALISAFITSFVLFIGSIGILYESIPRIMSNSIVNSTGMILISIFGLCINSIGFFSVRKGDSANEKMVTLHLLEDVLGWVVVLLGAICIHFFQVYWLDPILSIGIGLFILWNVFKNFKNFINIILQGIPDHIDLKLVINKVKQLPNVQSIHDVHIWSMDGLYNVISIHIVVGDQISNSEIIQLKKESKTIFREFKIQHETIEIGYESEPCEFVQC